jgi:short-subunit dehydrogenase
MKICRKKDIYRCAVRGSSMSSTREPALITGASAGIGRALAERFASAGHDVILVARREEALRESADRLEDQYGITASVVVQDLAERDGPEQLYDRIQERGLDVGVLVNNVGIATQGTFTDIDLDRERDQLRLDVETPTVLSKLFGREMVARGRGKILNVASSAAFQPGPFMAVYYASKSYVLSFSEAIAEELREDGVTVSVLCPGPVDTEFQERASMADTPLGSGPMQDVAAVADAGYEGLMDGKTVIVPGYGYKLLWHTVGLVPRPLVRKTARWLNE